MHSPNSVFTRQANSLIRQLLEGAKSSHHFSWVLNWEQ